jgi:hypothetical protein
MVKSLRQVGVTLRRVGGVTLRRVGGVTLRRVGGVTLRRVGGGGVGWGLKRVPEKLLNTLFPVWDRYF